MAEHLAMFLPPREGKSEGKRAVAGIRQSEWKAKKSEFTGNSFSVPNPLSAKSTDSA